jgi:class 3 adenylate cyclase/tetratricopeptide (TPR) repeat protein
MVCPSCGKENPEGFQFCGFCRASLEDVPTAPITEERKIVTVLFCDLVGFTARSDEADPEDVRATLRPFHQMLRREIERYGGTVVMFIGDAVMAVFGAPIAHEDDAERAVRAGLRILETIPGLASSRPELELSVRIGINTGEAVVALGARPEEGEGIVAGDVVNAASRLQGAAPIRGIAVGELTYRITKDVFDYEELEPVTLRGKSEPVTIWRAVAARSRFGVDVHDESVPFVGREEERTLLQGAFRRAVRESSVQLVTVIGEPGVGKSRLVGELFSYIDEIEELVAWRQGRCLPYGEGITFWALGEIVKAQAGILESDATEVASAKLEETIGTLIEAETDRRWTLERLAPLIGLGTKTWQGADDEESFAAWRGFLEAIAGDDVLVAVFEDLHWADEALLKFIEHLGEWSSGVALIVVCTARPELFERHPNWGAGGRNATTISLSPLTDTETSLLIASLLAHAVLPAEVHAAVLERSGGNPLYAEEFIRMLKDRGILEEKGRSLALAPEEEIPFPDSVQALIAARLDTLTPERKALLQDGAVVGKVFWAGAVSFIGDRDGTEVREGLHELARKELVRPSRTSSVKEETEYAFWHALVRDVAYSQIPRSARADKHLAAAAWIVGLARDRLADHAEVLAHHYGQALELARSSGRRELEAIEEPLMRFLELAGDRAMQLDVNKASRFFERALSICPPEDPRRAHLLEKVGTARTRSGRFDEAERSYAQAVEMFREQGSARDAARVSIELTGVLRDKGNTSDSRVLLEQALALLEGQQEGPEHVDAYLAKARDYMLTSQGDLRVEWANRAIDLAQRLDMPDQIARARRFVAGRGEHEALREALRIDLETGTNSYETSGAYNNLAQALFELEGPNEALQILSEGMAFAERRGLDEQAKWMQGSSTWMLYELGQWPEALGRAERVLDWDAARTESQLGTILRSSKAQLLAAQGRLSEALPLRERFLPEARRIGDPQLLGPMLVIAAAIDIGAGKSASTVPMVQEFRDVVADEQNLFAWYIVVAARVLVAAGEPLLVEGMLPDEEPFPRIRNACKSVRAIVAESQGEFDTAASLYAEAERDWAAFGHVVEQAHATFGMGRCLAQMGAANAIGTLLGARQAFLKLGAAPLTAETDSCLANVKDTL